MRVCYVRVSTVQQNTGRQFEMLKAYDIEKVFEEKVSGKDTNRPQLKGMLDFLREGDTLYVESFSRLARSLSDLLNIVDKLTEKNISFISIKEKIDTSTPTGRLQLAVFGAIHQFEREQNRERQNEGIILALRDGRDYGRPKIKINDSFIAGYKQWRNGEVTAVEAMRLCNMKKNTFYKRVKEYEQTNLNENNKPKEII